MLQPCWQQEQGAEAGLPADPWLRGPSSLSKSLILAGHFLLAFFCSVGVPEPWASVDEPHVWLHSPSQGSSAHQMGFVSSALIFPRDSSPLRRGPRQARGCFLLVGESCLFFFFPHVHGGPALAAVTGLPPSTGRRGWRGRPLLCSAVGGSEHHVHSVPSTRPLRGPCGDRAPGGCQVCV